MKVIYSIGEGVEDKESFNRMPSIIPIVATARANLHVKPELFLRCLRLLHSSWSDRENLSDFLKLTIYMLLYLKLY